MDLEQQQPTTTTIKQQNGNLKGPEVGAKQEEIGRHKAAQSSELFDENNNNNNNTCDYTNGKLNVQDHQDHDDDDDDEDEQEVSYFTGDKTGMHLNGLGLEFGGHQVAASQPMSIDPSLCQGLRPANQVKWPRKAAGQLTEVVVANNGDNNNNNKLDSNSNNNNEREQGGAEHLGSLIKVAKVEVKACEEQSAREDFSSSASSSLIELNTSSPTSSTSACSSSSSSSVVVSVTTAGDQDGTPALTSSTSNNNTNNYTNLSTAPPCSAELLPAALSECSPDGSVATVLDLSQPEAISVDRILLDKMDVPMQGAQPEQEVVVDDELVDDDDDENNIGVAFESLQFETEIKSSKAEIVDSIEHELLAPEVAGSKKVTLAKPIARARAKFEPSPNSANFQRLDEDQEEEENDERDQMLNAAMDVSSVCNLIDAAISDADKQVNRLTNSNNEQQQMQKQQHSSQLDFRPPSGNVNRKATMLELQQQQSQLDGAPLERASLVSVKATRDGSGSDEDNAAAFQPPSNRKRLVSSRQNLSVESDAINSSSGSSSELEQSKANLSQMFEANVRREIERFESNSLTSQAHSQPANQAPEPFKIGSGSATMNSGLARYLEHQQQQQQHQSRSIADHCKSNQPVGGSTEWRIAEEIRQFNERELELKRRLGKTTAPTNDRKGEKSSLGKDKSESIVRFGKILQIPKSQPTKPSVTSNGGAVAAAENASGALSFTVDTSSNGKQAAGQVKLTTSARSREGQQQSSSVISMHKFISSSGKRFVFTTSSSSSASSAPSSASSSSCSSTTSSTSSSTTSALSSSTSARSTPANSCYSHPTAGLSPHSFISVSQSPGELAKNRKQQQQQQQPEPTRQVDFKASDSLNCKETPQVEPGKARKVIESFSRLVQLSNSNNNGNIGNRNHADTATSGTTSNQHTESNSFQASRQSASNRLPVGQSSENRQGILKVSAGGGFLQPHASIPAELKIQDELREMRAREAELRDQRTAASKRMEEDHESPIEPKKEQESINCKTEQARTSDFEPEALYPIRATIDTFRKLTNSKQQQQVGHSTRNCSTRAPVQVSRMAPIDLD